MALYRCPSYTMCTRPTLPADWTTAGANVACSAVWFRVDDGHGKVADFCILSKPGAGISHLGALAATQIRDLDPATDKARRDAPAIPVCFIDKSTR
jgi:hypothetical protein